MKLLRYIFIAIFAVSFSCSDSDEPGNGNGGGQTVPLQFEITDEKVDSDNKIYLSAETVEEFVELKTNYSLWNAYVKSDSDWIKVFDRKEPDSDRLKIATEENDELTSRTAEVEFQLGGDTRQLTVVQFGYEPEIFAEPTSFEFNFLENEFEVTVASNVSYEVVIPEVDKAWISEVIVPTTFAAPTLSKTHHFKVEENGTSDERSTKIIFYYSEEASASVIITQSEMAIVEVKDPADGVLNINFTEQDIHIVLATNQEEVEMDISAAWIEFKSYSLTNDASIPKEYTYVFSVPEELGTSDREATIKFSSLGIEDMVLVKQSRQLLYDTKVLVVDGWTDNYFGTTFPNSYDGDMGTHYDSNYNLPSWVETTLVYELYSETRFIDYIVYYNRYDAGNHGAFGNFDVLYSTADDPDNFILIGNYTTPEDAYRSPNGFRIDFDRVMNPKYIKFYVYTNVTGNYICCKEMEFYQHEGQSPPYISVYPGVSQVSYENTTLNLDITSNMSYSMETSDWIERTPARSASFSPPRETQAINFTVRENPSSIGRKGYITLTGEDGTSFTATIFQAGNYNLISAVANSEQPGNGIELTLDGDFVSHWHTRWSDPRLTVSETTPAIATYTFNDSPGKISSVRYYTRNGNGRWGKFQVYVQAAGGNMELVGNGDNRFNTTGYTEVFFDTVLNPEKVELVVTEGSGDFASCVQMEFYE